MQTNVKARKEIKFLFNILISILKQLSPFIREQLDFIIEPGHIISLSTLNSIMAQMHQGNASFDGIEKVNREIITHELLRKEKLRLMYLKRRNQSQFISEKVCLSDGPVIRFLDLFVVTSSIAKYQFKAEMRRRMGFYQSSFLNAACGGKIFQLDSVFP